MFTGFSAQALDFFGELRENNNRDWFARNKSRYEGNVLEPALEFVAALQQPLHKVSPHFLAVPKKSGGSIMRIYRDTRFSKDKTPYKTNLGIQFRHEAGKDAHAPGFYFHLDENSIFMGAGIWNPEVAVQKQIRELIDDDQPRWTRLKNKKLFRETFEFHGESLKRPPQGFDNSHPLIEDLRRKDHFIAAPLSRREISTPGLIDMFINRAKLALPYMRFLCDAIRRPC